MLCISKTIAAANNDLLPQRASPWLYAMIWTRLFILTAFQPDEPGFANASAPVTSQNANQHFSINP